MKCQCVLPGFCPIHNRQMSEVRWNECRNKPGYFEVFAESRIKREIAGVTINYGAGTELTKLLGSIGITYKENCKCKKHTEHMDKLGTEWCREHTDTIIGWLQEEASRRRIPFIRVVATKILNLAISRAERNLKKERV